MATAASAEGAVKRAVKANEVKDVGNELRACVAELEKKEATGMEDRRVAT